MLDEKLDRNVKKQYRVLPRDADLSDYPRNLSMIYKYAVFNAKRDSNIKEFQRCMDAAE